MLKTVLTCSSRVFFCFTVSCRSTTVCLSWNRRRLLSIFTCCSTTKLYCLSINRQTIWVSKYWASNLKGHLFGNSWRRWPYCNGRWYLATVRWSCSWYPSQVFSRRSPWLRWRCGAGCCTTTGLRNKEDADANGYAVGQCGNTVGTTFLCRWFERLNWMRHVTTCSSTIHTVFSVMECSPTSLIIGVTSANCIRDSKLQCSVWRSSFLYHSSVNTSWHLVNFTASC